jgi:Ca2+-binding EF-hand superfamily protein
MSGRRLPLDFIHPGDIIMSKPSLPVIATALSVLSLAGGAALAGQHHAKLEAAFQKADKDNDGTLDREEAKAMPRVAKRFDAIDADKDGSVDLDEIKASMEKAGREMHKKGETAFKQADKDNDGTLDKEEAKAMPRVAEHFDAIDADKDGTVSREEIHTYMQSRRK